MRTVKHILDEKGYEVLAISPQATVLEAIRHMAESSVGALLVMEGAQLSGIISERDYARKVILEGRSSAETAVGEIMSAPVVAVTPDDNIHACMQLMTERRMRHLPVVDQERVVGVLSIGDLVKAVIADQQQEIAQLQQYIVG